MKKSVYMISALVVAFGLGTAVAAASESQFDNHDGNHDGQITFDEAMGDFPTLSRVLFDAADEDKNGTLNEAEYESLFGLGCVVK